MRRQFDLIVDASAMYDENTCSALLDTFRTNGRYHVFAGTDPDARYRGTSVDDIRRNELVHTVEGGLAGRGDILNETAGNTVSGIVPRNLVRPHPPAYRRIMPGVRVDPTTEARVRDAMSSTRRADFLPPEVRHLSAADHPVMIGWNATNSQPSTVARMLGLLDVQPGDRVLDVGSGSGWTTAVLATLTGPEDIVIGVERVPELVDYGRERLAETGSHAEIRAAIRGVWVFPMKRRSIESWSPHRRRRFRCP